MIIMILMVIIMIIMILVVIIMVINILPELGSVAAVLFLVPIQACWGSTNDTLILFFLLFFQKKLSFFSSFSFAKMWLLGLH